MRHLLAGLALPVLFLAQSASAHFLFIKITPQAEAGRAAEVYFSERAEAGDPRFVEKVEHTRLWYLVDSNWEPLNLMAAVDRLRAPLPALKTVAVVGQCQYGVLTREVPFLLRYYPKSVAGSVEEINQLAPSGRVALEIMPTFEKDGVSLVLLKNGKPVPKVVFTTIDDDLDNEELTADGEGRVFWKPERTGQYSVYAKVVTPESGEIAGKSYQEIREFPTLSFSWPLNSQVADPGAVEMFQKAVAARATWQGFPGFKAKISGSNNGRYFSGTAEVSAECSVKLKLDDETSNEWVDEQLQSIAMHRQPSADRGQPVLRWADSDERHPLGRLLTFVGGQFASTYRVRGDELIVVNRNMGQKNMTITVLENERNADGKHLPRAFTVQYWEAATGTLLKTETVQNTWQRVGKFDLPSQLTVTDASDSGLVVRSINLTDFELLPAKSEASK